MVQFFRPWILLALTICLAGAGTASAETSEAILDRIARTGVLVAGTREDAPPFAFRDAQGHLSGFSVDIIEEIRKALAHKLGRDVRTDYVMVDSQTRMTVVEEHKADLVCETATETWPRQQHVDFTLPIFRDGTRILAYRDTIDSVRSLSDLHVGVIENSVTGEVLQAKLPGIALKQYKSMQAALQGLESGEVQGIANIGILLREMIASAAKPQDLVIVPRAEALGYETLACMVPKSDAQWRDFVNGVLRNLFRGIDDYRGGYVTIYNHWFGRDAEIDYPLDDRTVQFFMSTLGLARLDAMGLRTRLVLMAGISVSLGIIAVALILTFLAWHSILEQAEAEGLVIAQLLAESATVSERIVVDVRTTLDREMVAEGLLVSHLADVADKAGMSDRNLSRLLMEVTARSPIGEIWISDANGNRRASSIDDSGGPDKVTTLTGLPAGSIDGLLAGTVFSESLGVGRPRFGGTPMQYVGVRGMDSARSVLVGRDQAYITKLTQTLGVQGLLDRLQRTGTVEALRVIDADGREVASSRSSGQQPGDQPLSTSENALVRSILSGRPAGAIVSHGWISVAAAIPDDYGVPAGVALARLSTAPLDSLIGNYIRIGGAAALAALLIGIGLSVVTGSRIAMPMMRISRAADAVDARKFVLGSLGDVASRRDELGDLARTFESMAAQVFAREEELERQVSERTKELQIKNEQLDLAKRRLEADLELAKLLQATILPRTFPSEGNWRATARMTPALQMAGDFYDFFPLDAERLGLLIADVSGKGVAPAFFMAVSRAALREAARHYDLPGDCLAAANDRLCEQNPLDMFVTVFYAVVDQTSGEVIYANGGHNRPYLIARNESPREVPLTGGMALGVMPGIGYSSATLKLQQGDTLFLYTDGVPEAMNSAYEQFGTERLEAILAETADDPVDDMLNAVTDAVQKFVGSAPQSDDITCLVVRYVGGTVEYAPRKRAELVQPQNDDGNPLDRIVGR